MTLFLTVMCHISVVPFWKAKNKNKGKRRRGEGEEEEIHLRVHDIQLNQLYKSSRRWDTDSLHSMCCGQYQNFYFCKLVLRSGSQVHSRHVHNDCKSVYTLIHCVYCSCYVNHAIAVRHAKYGTSFIPIVCLFQAAFANAYHRNLVRKRWTNRHATPLICTLGRVSNMIRCFLVSL